MSQDCIMNTYKRFPLVLTEGKGVYVYDDKGKKYLDFVAGIAVNSLGHAHEGLVCAIAKQAGSLIHVSNLYWTKPQLDLAKKLTDHSCFERVFFCNSGAEGIECALKLTRKYADMKQSGKTDILTMKNSFHGRTYGAITATGQEKYQAGLKPLLPGISHVEFNNFEALEKAVTDKTGAIFIEPIQGEGGINEADKAYLQKVRALCTEKGILLVFDEVQCGVGRAGALFAHQLTTVEPDICVIAKGLAGGVPIGACLTTNRIAEAFKPGDHASTFGGNPLATAAANVVIDELLGGLQDKVCATGKHLTQKLLALQAKCPIIKEVRGKGLIQGIELTEAAGTYITKALENGLLLVASGEKVIRFVPPLIVSEEEIDMAMEILEKTLLS